MALKYYIEYNDVTDVTHRLEIYDDSFGGAATEVKGSVFRDYSIADNPLECVRGSGLRVELEADSTSTFSDLYAEEQRTFQVIYKRATVTKFTGWLNSEGWFEDFVNDKWVISFDCLDGLSYLKDLSWVEDSTGLNFVGTYSQLDILSKALIRTGLQQNINIDIQIFYTGLAEADCVLESVYARSTRYIKDDKNTVMSCEEVLKDVLEPYGACITSLDGEWFIYKPNQLFTGSELDYHSFDYLGVQIGAGTTLKSILVTLGSQQDQLSGPSQTDVEHVNANQSISYKNSLGAYRINYKYGEAKSLIGNDHFAGTDPIDDWVTNSTTVPTTPTPAGVTALTFDNPGLTFRGILETNVPVRTKMMTTEIVGLSEGDLLKYKFRANSTLPIGAGWEMDWVIRIYSTTATNTNPIYSGGRMWNTSTPLDITKTFTGGQRIFEQVMDAIPQDGKLILELWSAETKDAGSGLPPVSFDIELQEFSFAPSDDQENVLEGEFHTFQRIAKPAVEIDDVKEVFTGDSATDLFVGTLYKADGNTPTTTWFRSGITEDKPILQIMGEEMMRMRQSPARIFSGDVFGYFDYLSVFVLNDVAGTFMCTEYSHDTKMNIISCKFNQMYIADLGTDIDYEYSLDYGNVVTPTIKG